MTTPAAGTFSLLWGKILDSSIWMEDKETRLVWITLLAMKDQEGIVRAVPKALAHRARVTMAECEKALAVLMAPDPSSSTRENDGRRIRELENGGGWQILNHELYRFSTEAKRVFWADQKRKQREKVARGKSGKPLPGEQATIAAEEAGDQNGADAITSAALPEGKVVPRGTEDLVGGGISSGPVTVEQMEEEPVDEEEGEE